MRLPREGSPYVNGTFSRTDLVKLLLEENDYRRKIASAYRGNHIWAVWEEKETQERYISVIVVYYEYGNKFEKFKLKYEKRESDNLDLYSCPLSYLKMTPVKSEKWRNKVLELRVKKYDPFLEIIEKFEIAQKEDKIVRVYLSYKKKSFRYWLCCDYLDIERVSKRMILGRWRDGKLYSLLPKYVRSVEIIDEDMFI